MTKDIKLKPDMTLSEFCLTSAPIENHALTTTRDLSAWLSPRDAVHLIERAILAEICGSLIVNGISNNRFKRLEIESSYMALGYQPTDDAFAIFKIPIDEVNGANP